jgi:hypothetical protein
LAISEQGVKPKKWNLSDLCSSEDKQVNQQDKSKCVYKKRSSNDNKEHEDNNEQDDELPTNKQNKQQRPKRNYRKK